MCISLGPYICQPLFSLYVKLHIKISYCDHFKYSIKIILRLLKTTPFPKPDEQVNIMCHTTSLSCKNNALPMKYIWLLYPRENNLLIRTMINCIFPTCKIRKRAKAYYDYYSLYFYLTVSAMLYNRARGCRFKELTK